MNVKKIIVIIIVILLSISIALLPIIASFAAEEDHGMDAHSPSMSVGSDKEPEAELTQAVDEQSEDTQSDDATLTADADEQAEDNEAEEQGFFEAHKMQVIIGGSAVVLIIILAMLKRAKH